MNMESDTGVGANIQVQVVRDSDTMIIIDCFFYSYQGVRMGQG